MECVEQDSVPHEGAEASTRRVEGVIKEGILLCQSCKVWYPIHSYIPVMVTFENDFNKHFSKMHASQLLPYRDYRMPNEGPLPGELSVQDTFTDQWECVQNDDLSFMYSESDLKELHQRVWLKGIGSSAGGLKTLLNIGCGLGRESIALQEVTNNTDLFAIDLNFALLKVGEIYKRRPGIHFIIASLFALPFESSSFDLVYSQGVIHHTYCTASAFRSIASMVRKGGHLFIWVYGLDDRLRYGGARGGVMRAKFVAEGMVRPLVSRSPKVVRHLLFSTISLLYHPLTKVRARHKNKWKLKNTNHMLRDWLSPRYAHRHSYNEVFEWFEDARFEIVDVQSPAAYRRLFQRSLWGVGVTGKKIA